MGYPLGRSEWVLKCFGHILSIARAHFVTFLLSLPMIVIWLIKGLARDLGFNGLARRLQ